MISKQSRSIIGIMAATKDGVIGCNNALPWYYPGEIKHFRATTHNSIVIMGRNTYQSMPKTLFIDRQAFVLSNDTTYN